MLVKKNASILTDDLLNSLFLRNTQIQLCFLKSGMFPKRNMEYFFKICLRRITLERIFLTCEYLFSFIIEVTKIIIIIKNANIVRTIQSL